MSEVEEQAERPVNPLLVPRRRETVELYRDDVAQALAAKVAELDEVLAEIDEIEARESEGGGKPKRMNRKPEKVEKREQAEELAREYDALAESPSVSLTFEEPLYDDWARVKNDHPPREDDRFDLFRGFNRETAPSDLARLCLVDPVVSDEHWAEFRRTVTAYNWEQVILPALERLTGQVPNLPKPLAVSALQERTERLSKQQPASGSHRGSYAAGSRAKSTST